MFYDLADLEGLTVFGGFRGFWRLSEQIPVLTGSWALVRHFWPKTFASRRNRPPHSHSGAQQGGEFERSNHSTRWSWTPSVDGGICVDCLGWIFDI